MEDKKFQVAATIESVATRADNTIKLVVSCQELSPEQSTALFALKSRLGWFCFAEQPLQPADIPNEPINDFRGQILSPSRRLRACLWQFWNKCTAKRPDFETFYQQWIERKINEIKEQIN